uniref:putative pumilio homolog 8, chloroplastic n=1 Tax=Erigeron canadensis TaxID=72917 RepID=UPI001CB9D6AA|nr:putative pumilio homolog 8, chloroplastic [Erigeron canadensis]
MEQKRSIPSHYAIEPPCAVNGDDGDTPTNDRHPATYSYPLSTDAVCDVFSSLNIAPGNRMYFLESYSGEYGGAGASIDGGFGGNRIYSSVGQSTHLMVDPHHQYNKEVGSSKFDPRSDFVDQRFDLLNKEQQKLNSHYHYSHSGTLNGTMNNSLRFSRFVIDDNNDNVASSKLTNYQLLSRMCLKELRGKIVCLAKDLNGCRLLQAKFENPTKEEIEIVLYEVLDSITDLMKDQFASYLIQKLIVVCNDDHKLRILHSLTKVPVEMVLVCMNPHGTRAMQKLLENLTVPCHIDLATQALRPSAARLANDAHGHHAIQYCLIHFSSNFSECTERVLCLL